MALVLLDGSDASIDINIGSNSMRCAANYWSADINREFTERTTFCTEGFRERSPGLKQITGRVEGFPSIGVAWSDPLYFFPEDNEPLPVILTAYTGAFFSFDAHVTRHHTGMRAGQNGELAIDFESAGIIDTTWAVS